MPYLRGPSKAYNTRIAGIRSRTPYTDYTYQSSQSYPRGRLSWSPFDPLAITAQLNSKPSTMSSNRKRARVSSRSTRGNAIVGHNRAPVNDFKRIKGGLTRSRGGLPNWRQFMNNLSPILVLNDDSCSGAYYQNAYDSVHKGVVKIQGQVFLEHLHGLVNANTLFGSNTPLQQLYLKAMASNTTNNDTYQANGLVNYDRQPFGTSLIVYKQSTTHTYTNQSSKTMIVTFYEYTPKRDFYGGTDATVGALSLLDHNNVFTRDMASGNLNPDENTTVPTTTAITTMGDQRFAPQRESNYLNANWSLIQKKICVVNPGGCISYTVQQPFLNVSEARWKNRYHENISSDTLNKIPNLLAGFTRSLCVRIHSEIGRNDVTGASNADPTTDTEFGTVGYGGFAYTHTSKEYVRWRAIPFQSKGLIKIKNFSLDATGVDVHVNEDDEGQAQDLFCGTGGTAGLR